MDDTASFPRGGRHGTVKKEPSSSSSKRSRENNSDSSKVAKRNKKTESEPDFLFGNHDDKNKENKQRKKRKTSTSGEAVSASSTSHSLLPLGGGGVVVVKKGIKSEKGGKAATSLSSSLLIESFGFSKLAKGTQVLGIVREVQSEYAIVSLPNTLSGYILPQQQSGSSPSLLNCLSVGQVLAVEVQKVATETIGRSHQQQQRRRIQVSPFPSHVNPRGGDEQELFHKKNTKLPIRGQISSIEDHGCLVDLGFGRKGFLKYEDIVGSNYKVLDVDDEETDDDSDSNNDEGGVGSEKKEKKRKSRGSPYIIQPGRLYDFYVSGNSSSDKIFGLSLPSVGALAGQSVAPILNTKSKYSSTTPYTLNSIRPGWLVTAKVEAIAKNGLCVTFLNNVFRGAIELGHLGANFIPTSKEEGTAGWHDVFTKHQHFQARVVAIDVPTKTIRLSLASHILEMKNIMMSTTIINSRAVSPSTSFPEIGSIVEDCTVIRQDPGIGALLALPASYNRDYETEPLSKRISKSDLFKNDPYAEATKTRTVYVHISKAIDDMDTTGAVFSKDFAPSTTHSVRILGMGSLVDGVATGACAKSILDAHVLTHADLKPGQLYKQVPVCAQLKGGSILVQLGGHKNFNSNTDVRGLIPAMHLFDTSNSSEFRRKLLKAKYAVDAKIDVRVLSVDTKNKKCIVTAKKSMVKVGDDSEIVTSFDDLKVGKHAVGYVSRIDERNIFVSFCNKVFGRVTAKSLAADLGIENHTDSYHVGDVVKCRVVKMKKRKSFGGSKANTLEDNDVNYDDSDDEEGPSFWEVDLSLKVEEREGNEDDGEGMQVGSEEKQIRIKAGAILPLKSMKIVQLNSGRIKKNGSFVPGYAIVSIKSKHVVDESMQSGVASNIECKLPYDQLLDSYDPEDVQSATAFDRLARRLLSVGKKINQKGMILTDPHKSNVDYTTGIGKLPFVSIRKSLIQTAEKQYALAAAEVNDPNTSSSCGIIIPDPDSDLYVGAVLQGYVGQVDPRHGAFIRFLDGMTGLIPKSFGGCDVPAYETVITKVKEIDDKQRPYRILLNLVGDKKLVKGGPYHVGDKIAAACIKDVRFHETELALPEGQEKSMARIVLHSTMKDCKETKVKYRKGEAGRSEKNRSQEISKGHPFYGLKVGDNLSDLTVVGLNYLKGRFIVYVADRSNNHDADNKKYNNAAPIFVSKRSDLVPGMILTAFVDDIADKNKGIFVHVSPVVKGFIPGVEISRDLRILNSLRKHVKTGTRIKCRVMDQSHWHQVRGQCPFASQQHHSLLGRKSEQADNPQLFLSLISCEEEAIHPTKPKHGDLLIGRIQKSLPPTLPPCLMISLRGGYVARSCITELEETDDWSNMPIGSVSRHSGTEIEHKQDDDNDIDAMDVEETASGNEGDADGDKEIESHSEPDGLYADGKYVECRVLKTFGKQSLVDVSLRPSRVEGDLDEDPTPELGETAQGYVVQTNKQGCFIRIARHIEGRATLKELCDGYLPHPETSFPMGRLVVGKVKEVHNVKKKSKNSKDPVRVRVDLDMRESTLLDGGKNVEFEDIQLNHKYNGTVTRVESYGVFVQVENSKVCGLVHMSECSDKFIKNLDVLYSPGDLVKILVIKKDTEARKLGFSMKPSHFEDDEDSDDDSVSDDESGQGDEDQVMLMDQSDDDISENELDSDDDDFASKLAAKMQADSDGDSDENSSDSSSSEGSDDDDSDDSVEDTARKEGTAKAALDTDVGFEWGAGVPKAKSEDKDDEDKDDSDDESSSSSDDDDGEDAEKTSSHKSRKKQAQRRREEREIARRENALADGTADENPETAGDFERLLAGNPNSSELWIRYMAFHLSLSDIPAARAVAEKAMERIEFRQEKEKLNVWTALLTLEHKYGNEKSFGSAIERACGQNNPKQAYLRACEILEKDVSSSHSPDSISRADKLFSKMCKKFKSKKTVWLAHLQYLLKQHRHQEGHALMKRALLSLPPYKHAETMSRFAQLEFEFGSLERARTVFDGIIEKYPKRLDLFFVYVDKEIKFGSLETARSLLKKKVDERSLSDKKMKNLFKKWYRLEEEHGNDESQEAVKASAREYVGNA